MVRPPNSDRGNATIYREVVWEIKLGDLKLFYEFLVAVITRECILGMDFLATQGCNLDDLGSQMANMTKH